MEGNHGNGAFRIIMERSGAQFRVLELLKDHVERN